LLNCYSKMEQRFRRNLHPYPCHELRNSTLNSRSIKKLADTWDWELEILPAMYFQHYQVIGTVPTIATVG
jgi:hypothetical protein